MRGILAWDAQRGTGEGGDRSFAKTQKKRLHAADFDDPNTAPMNCDPPSMRIDRLSTGQALTQNGCGMQMATASPLAGAWIDAYDGHHPIVDVGCAYGLAVKEAAVRLQSFCPDLSQLPSR